MSEGKQIVHNRYTLREYARGAIFFTLYGIVKYLPSPLCDVLRYAVLKLFMKNIRSLRIKDGATFWFPESISIGRNCSVNEWVFIDGFGGVEIGNDVRIAHGVSIVSEDHGVDDLDLPIWRQKKIPARIVIGNDVWIGMGARITSGVRIADGAVIATGAVVTSDVPERTIVAGVPARVIRVRGAR